MSAQATNYKHKKQKKEKFKQILSSQLLKNQKPYRAQKKIIIHTVQNEQKSRQKQI